MIDNVMKILPSDLDKKTVGIVLISKDEFYISDDGKLPKRPPFDKELITKLATDNIVLCSENTFPTIPPSIRKVVKELTTDINSNWNVNFGINTFKEKTDYFILVKSNTDLGSGKTFNVDRLATNYTSWNEYKFDDGFSIVIFK